MLNEHKMPNIPQASEIKPVVPANLNEGSTSEAAGDNGSKPLPNASAETNELAALVQSNAAASLNTPNTVAPPAKTASTESKRKVRTPQQKALDDAVEAHRKATEKGLAAIEAARANLQESDRERKFAAGTRMMHKLLLKCTASTRGAVIAMLSGIADDMGQEALQAYLEALNSTPVKN